MKSYAVRINIRIKDNTLDPNNLQIKSFFNYNKNLKIERLVTMRKK